MRNVGFDPGVGINWLVDTAFGRLPLGDPEAVALSLEAGERWTYAQLREARDRHANALLDLGVAKGDRVALLLPNSLRYVALHLALARIGAIGVRLNFRLSAAELAYALGDSGTKVLILEDDCVERIDAVRGELAVEHYLAGGAAPPAWAEPLARLDAGAPGAPDVPLPGAEDPLTILYTSGTTGAPKGAVWSHANALASAAMQVIKWRLGPDSVAMTTGPLYHAGSLEHLVLPVMLARGRAVLTRSGGFEVERMVATIASEGVTDIGLPPFMVYGMLRLPGGVAGRIPSLRRIISGGDVFMPWAYEAMAEQLPGVELAQSYGLTEGAAMTCLDGADAAAHPTSIGRPMPLHEVRVVDADRRPVAAGEVGEIEAAGPAVTIGYWERPEETAETFPDRWLRTGDLGTVSPDGFLSIAGRGKDMYRSGGENVYPAEVERVLTKHAAIADAAVFGVPDERFVEVGCAALVLAEGGSPPSDQHLDAYCRERLAAYKCPKHVIWVDSLPRNLSGKILKRELRDRFDSEAATTA